MAKARVYNENKITHKETFKDDLISIPPGGYIEMDYFDAVEFLGQYRPRVVDADGADKPEGFKMLKIVKDEDFVPETTKGTHDCIACKYKATSQADLDEHTKVSHAAQVVVDEEAEKEIKRRKRAG